MTQSPRRWGHRAASGAGGYGRRAGALGMGVVVLGVGVGGGGVFRKDEFEF